MPDRVKRIGDASIRIQPADPEQCKRMWKSRLRSLTGGVLAFAAGLAARFLRAQLNDRLPHLTAVALGGLTALAGIALYQRRTRQRNIASTGCKPEDLLFVAPVHSRAAKRASNDEISRVFDKGGLLFVFVSNGRLIAYGVPVGGEAERIHLATSPTLDVFECRDSVAELRFTSDGEFSLDSFIRRGPSYRRLRSFLVDRAA